MVDIPTWAAAKDDERQLMRCRALVGMEFRELEDGWHRADGRKATKAELAAALKEVDAALRKRGLAE
jgi:hypothetical protein